MAERRPLYLDGDVLKEVGDGDTLTGAGSFLTGMVMGWHDTVAPSGWLLYDGATIGNAGSGADHAGAEYAALFEMVKARAPNTGSESFAGGDVVTLPDSRGRMPIGAETGTDHDLGEVGGVASHNLAHTHSVTPTEKMAEVNEILGEGFSGSGTFNTTSAGGTIDNRPPYFALNWIIKI